MDDLRFSLVLISRLKGISRLEKRRLAERLKERGDLPPEIGTLLKDDGKKRDVYEDLRYLGKIKSRLITIYDDDYPPLLKEIPDAPIVLYAKGPLKVSSETISICGSRKASIEGINLATKIGESLSFSGITVVSGLAVGIDAASHRGALMGPGKTVAVLGSGIDVCYPSENRYLYDRISEEGLIISEYPPRERPLKFHFPERNRIIAGISRAVLVVEASRKSGALITARFGMEYGREVMAIPGNIFEERYSGTNYLIKKGATLVQSLEDIVETAFPGMRISRPLAPQLEREEEIVYSIIGESRIHVDEIIEGSRLESSKVLSILTMLEMKGLVRSYPGGYYVRV